MFPTALMAAQYNSLVPPPAAAALGECRICGGGSADGKLEKALCACIGSVADVHMSCLETWIVNRPAEGEEALLCEICRSPYRVVLAPVFDPALAFRGPACRQACDGCLLLVCFGMTIAAFIAVTPEIDSRTSLSERILLYVLLASSIVITFAAVKKLYERWRLASSSLSLQPAAPASALANAV